MEMFNCKYISLLSMFSSLTYPSIEMALKMFVLICQIYLCYVRKGFRGMHIIIRPFIYTLDCEQLLFFFASLLKPSTRAEINEGVSPRRKNKRLLTLLFCLGTTKLSK